MGKLLYKYLPPERIDDVIGQSWVRFSPLSILNDPFESRPLVSPTQEYLSFRQNSSVPSVPPNSLQLRDGMLWLLDREITEWLGPDAQNLLGLSVEDRQFAFAFLAACLQDPELPNSPSRMGEFVNQYTLNRFGVLALSSTYDSLLMWAHYTDSSKGIVVGIDPEIAFPLNAGGRSPQGGDQLVPRSVAYRSQRSKITLGEHEWYQNFILEKPIAWSYEEEVRVTAPLESPLHHKGASADGSEIWLYTLPKESIREILLGSAIRPDDRKKVFEHRDRQSPQAVVKQSRLSDEHYSLNFFECDRNGEHS